MQINEGKETHEELAVSWGE